MAAAIPPASVSVTMTDSPLFTQPPLSQTLEDLACAYWSSDTLFAAIKLNIFGNLGDETLAVAELGQLCHCHPAELTRLLTALARLNLILEETDGWRNLPEAARHLIPERPEYLGDFLLYRRYLQPTWHTLTQTISSVPLSPALSRDDDYPTRNRHYVQALDQLARLKAQEIVAKLNHIPWHGPILDLGGGAGALSRALTQTHRQQAVAATLFELPEVLAAAQALYPASDAWMDIAPLPGEFLSHSFADHDRFGLIVLSNFLHIYNATNAKLCLSKAVTLLRPSGHLLIHDYCPDRGAIKGPLYDLNMLINTPNGQCHKACDLATWLADNGLTEARIIDLASDSTLIIARRPS
ncbi:MAG: methyltransferase domain-containing protein [Desulfobulbaceae bacterium]|nr:methyltransferase domain-containing protein [Desulfobulbaceae bacterium]